jgi:deoxycytidine triphosphate deaminase
MAVLSREDIKDRLQDGEILDPNSVGGDIDNHIESASVMLTINRNRNIISNTIYADDIGNSGIHNDGDDFDVVDHPVPEYSDEFRIPSRELAILTTREKIDMPPDLVGRVGIRLSASKYGLIPLFGPQVDPGFEGRFYAIIYNASDQDFILDRGEFNLNGTEGGILKLEVQELTTPVANKYLEDNKRQNNNDPLLEFLHVDTQTPDLSDLREDLENRIDKFEKGLNKNKAAVTEVKKGYSQIILFGVFLLATATFGAVLPQIINAASAVTFGTNLETIILIVFGAAWLLTTIVIVVAVLFNIKRGSE